MEFIDNKYTKCYYRIISQAILRRHISGYVEKHHIIPSCLGGSNDSENKVLLTAREHYVCHRLLTKMTLGKSKQRMYAGWHALSCFANKHQKRKFKITSKSFAILREEYAKSISAKLKGRVFSKETKLKMSISQKGKIVPEHTKKKISESSKGRLFDNSHKEKISQGLKQFHSEKTIKYVCEHCGKETSLKTNFIRWHGDNCKSLSHLQN